jgi:hypothetical protein
MIIFELMCFIIVYVLHLRDEDDTSFNPIEDLVGYNLLNFIS